MIEADRQILDTLQKIRDASTGGGAPSGPAGGDLSGTYPNPTIKNGAQIFDDSHVLSADFGLRQLVLPNGTTGMRWGASGIVGGVLFSVPVSFDGDVTLGAINGFISYDGGGPGHNSIDSINRQLIAGNGTTVVLDWSDSAGVALGTIKSGNGANLTGVSASTVTGTTTNDNAVAGNVGEYISASRVVGSATALTTATPKTVTSIPLTAGDWDVTAIGALTGASTGTEFDVAIGTTTNSLTGTVLGDTRCQTPTVSLTGADATLMIPAVRVSISSTTTYYLIVQETFTVGSPAAYGRISARRVR